jgi:NADH dehydrogenase
VSASEPFDVVTGAFSYSGSAIARRLLADGQRVRTLTNHPERAPADSPIEAVPLDFTDADALARSLEGASTLYNTYWIRFARGAVTHESATSNSAQLFTAAARAGVGRIVHLSITNPSAASPYAYYRGKALAEEALANSGVSHAILRPAILFGGNGILVNNIAYFMRRLPVMGYGGRGEYRVRGVHVDDLAELCVAKAAETDNTTTDAVGPERPTFKELLRAIKTSTGSRAVIVPVPAIAFPVLTGAIGALMRDVLLTREEFEAMADGLADVEGPATAPIGLTSWVADNAAQLGREYLHEVRLHF